MLGNWGLMCWFRYLAEAIIVVSKIPFLFSTVNFRLSLGFSDFFFKWHITKAAVILVLFISVVHFIIGGKGHSSSICVSVCLHDPNLFKMQKKPRTILKYAYHKIKAIIIILAY